MPSRVVSGESLWTSHKLKKVPKEYRAEYANLIPLAEINGAFEADPELIWSKVYSFNRNDVTPKIVAEILDEFEKADMLIRYEADGKTYGYWVGIEKPGRLPGKSERSKYNISRLPPTPETLIVIPVDEPKPDVRETSSTLNMPLDSYIVEQCEQTIGYVETKQMYGKELRAAIKQFGHDEVLKAFNIWLPSALPFTGRKPILTFIKSIGSFTSRSKPQVTSPALQEVETQIALISDNQVFFYTNHKPLLASLISQYGKEDVIDAFQDFWNLFGADNNVSFAAKNFIEQASVRIESTRKNKQQQETKNRIVGASIQAARDAAETELEEQEEIEEEL